MKPMSSMAPSAFRVAAPSCPLITVRSLSRSASDTKRSILIVTGADAAAFADLALAVAVNVSAGGIAVRVVRPATPSPATRPMVAVALIRSLIFIHISVLAFWRSTVTERTPAAYAVSAPAARSLDPLPRRGGRGRPLGRVDRRLQQVTHELVIADALRVQLWIDPLVVEGFGGDRLEFQRVRHGVDRRAATEIQHAAVDV